MCIRDRAIALPVKFCRGCLDVAYLELDRGLRDRVRGRPLLGTEASVCGLRQGPHPEMLGALDGFGVPILRIRNTGRRPEGKAQSVDEETNILTRCAADDGKSSDKQNVHELSLSSLYDAARRPNHRSSTRHCVSMVAPTSPPWAGPFETPHDPSLSSVSRTRRVVGLIDVHDHRRSGSLQRGHLRTLERLVLWSTHRQGAAVCLWSMSIV